MLTNFTKNIKHLLKSASHLSPYLPFMQETSEQRVIRIINDNSAPSLIQPSISHVTQAQVYELPWGFASTKLRVFRPTEVPLLIWFFLVFVAVLYFYVEAGLVLTYGEEVWIDELHSPAYLTIDAIAVLVLIGDILVCLNCGYLYRGMIVMSRPRIVNHYLRRLFLLDLTFVIIVVLCPASGNYYLNFAKLLIFTKVFRLFEIDDFYLRSLNLRRKSKAVYVIFKLIVIIFALSHLIGLIFFAMDEHFLNSGYYAPDFCWLISANAYSPIISLDYPLKYLYTLYWGVNTITTISYGDIAPLNPIETNYCMVCFCFGFMVYGYVVNQIVKIILWAREHEDEFQN